jgi:hypothetical protein
MLDKLRQWVKEGEGRRSVTINIGEPRESDYLRIFVYDYSLMCGQAVQSVEEINLEAEKEKEDKEEFERLKAKFA